LRPKSLKQWQTALMVSWDKATKLTAIAGHLFSHQLFSAPETENHLHHRADFSTT
jgi:hypothetical protein